MIVKSKVEPQSEKVKRQIIAKIIREAMIDAAVRRALPNIYNQLWFDGEARAVWIARTPWVDQKLAEIRAEFARISECVRM